MHENDDLGASISSGSFKTDGMVVIPCSIKTLSGIAHSYNENLLTRAADVTLKERRRLVLVVRETPLHQGHIELMLQASRMGAILFPPMPAFYSHPKRSMISLTIPWVRFLISSGSTITYLSGGDLRHRRMVRQLHLIRHRKGGATMKKKKKEVSRISLPCPVILLSTGKGEEQDAMTATAMFVSEEPPLVVVSVGKRSFSHELIERTGEFVINVAATDQVKLAKLLGVTHGRELNKFREFKIGVEEAASVASPLIKGSFSHLECKVITSYPLGHYVLYLASVSAYRVKEKKVPLAWHAQRYFSLDKGVT